MKIATFNLAGYKDWSTRSIKIEDYLSELTNDVICFQEVRFDLAKSNYNQIDELNLVADYPYKIIDIVKNYTTSEGENYKEGLAIISKYPIQKAETIVLDKATDDKHFRYVQSVDIKVGDDLIKIANVHFSPNEYSVEQLKQVLDILHKRDEKRLLIGDFNILNRDQLRLLANNYKISTDFKNYISFPSKELTLDYLLLPEGFNFKNIEVVNGLSDHNLISFELDVVL